MSLRMLGSIGSALVLVLASSASAQVAEEGAPATEGEATPEEGSEQTSAEDEQAAAEETTTPERSETDPFEEEDTDYFFVGAFYRHVIIPSFIQDLFVESSVDGSNPGVGAFFNYRRNNLTIGVEAWWNNAEASGTFRGLGDPDTETEWVDAHLWAFFLDVSILWAFPITEWFAIEVGLDIGFGFIGGDIVRTEAYPSGTGYAACNGPGDPATGAYCGTNVAPPATCYNAVGEHYQCHEPNWLTEGGDVPFIMPWFSLPKLALRFKPIHQLQLRVEGGYGVYNFFFGLSAAYGI